MGCKVEVEVVMLNTGVMLFSDLMCSGLVEEEEEEKELVLPCFENAKEQDSPFCEACKSRGLGFAERQKQEDSSQRWRIYSYLSTENRCNQL